MKNQEMGWIIAGLFLWLWLKNRKAAVPGKPIPAKVTAPKVTPGSWIQFRELLGQKESAGNYKARRPNSQFWGKYQLGRLARSATVAKGKTWRQFQDDTALQDEAVKQWTTRALRELQQQPDAWAKVSKNETTWAQLAAMDHLTGRAATMKWIRTGETTKDGNGVENLAYSRPFRNFDLSALLERPTT